MKSKLEKKDIADAKKISALFTEISETSKMMAIAYLTALRNKELADGCEKKQIS